MSDLKLEKAKTLFLKGMQDLEDALYSAAEQKFRQSLELIPNRLSTMTNLVVALLKQGELDRAQNLINEILIIYPHDDVVNFYQGTVLRQRGDLEGALKYLDLAIGINPGSAAVHLEKALVLLQQEQPAKATLCLEETLKLDVSNTQALLMLGEAQLQAKSVEAAETTAAKVVKADPNNSQAWVLYARILLELNQYDRAVECCQQSLRVKKPNSEAYALLGLIQLTQKQPQLAVRTFNLALEINPNCLDSRLGLGSALMELGQLQNAAEEFLKAIQLRPSFAEAKFNLGFLRLLEGNFAQGWAGYEQRFLTARHRHSFATLPQPKWDGQQKLEGKSILVHNEQGFGDSLQFVRYTKLLDQLGAKVVLAVQRPLVKLFFTAPGVGAVMDSSEPVPICDYHCSLPSLPWAFQTEQHTVPCAQGYLAADPRLVSDWQQRLGHQTRARIGLVWSGSLNQKNDQRSMLLQTMLPYLNHDFEYICLTPKVPERDLAQLSKSAIRYFGSEITTFNDTAALCCLVDQVVTVDTAVAHLSGALARPTNILLCHAPDWRWMLETDRCIWYNSVKLYRQATFGDWHSILPAVFRDLTAKLKSL